MESNPDTSQREHQFGNIDTATQELNKLGFSLDDSLFPKELYHVVPIKIQDDHPKKSDCRTPRLVDVVDTERPIIFDKPFDNNPFLFTSARLPV